MPHAARRDAVRALLDARKTDALLVTDLLDTSLPHRVHRLERRGRGVPRGRGLLCTDGRYRLQAAAQCGPARGDRPAERGCRGRASRPGPDWADSATPDGGQARHGPGRGGTAPAPRGRSRPALRQVKNDGEVAAVRPPAAVNTALRALLDTGRARAGAGPGRRYARRPRRPHAAPGRGQASFDTILAAGANSGRPHHAPADAELCRGDLVKDRLRGGAGRHHSDTTQGVHLSPAAGWQRELHALVDAAAVRRAGRARRQCRECEVDAAARTVIEGGGTATSSRTASGTASGLAVHEPPWLARTGAEAVPAGAVVTKSRQRRLPGGDAVGCGSRTPACRPGGPPYR
ncbi:M24 family metallopeptidase [Pseudonocardia sp. MCCB 268]|nr:M24 family metallopeptidase [Pseudonocardia cytotoxica]